MWFENIIDSQIPFEHSAFTLEMLLIVLLVILLLKGLAMWKAAKNNQMIWFWLLLLVNTAGILPAIYLLFGGDN